VIIPTTDRRRQPVPRERYRSVARTAKRRRARPVLRWAQGALGVAFFITAFIALPRLGAGIGSSVGEFGGALTDTAPGLQGQLQLPAQNTSVGAAPIVEALPQFTREIQLKLAGKVPSFAIQAGRAVDVTLNGAPVATIPVDQSGLFAAPLVLREGANTIIVTLRSDREIIAASSYTITVDRTPPTLAVAQPKGGESVEGPTVVVAGTTEPGASLVINERTVVPNPEGAFSESFTATPGALPITVVARDKAGNETTTKLTVVVREPAPVGGPRLAVNLDKTKVKPGQFVNAFILLSDSTGAKVNVTVTLSVGVVTIGSAQTDASGTAHIFFAAPTTEGDIGVVVLGGGASGRATLTVSAN
jgi:hypothetical protein